MAPFPYMEEVVLLRGGVAGLCAHVEHKSGDLLPALLRMDDAVSTMADVLAGTLFSPSGDYFADRRKIVGVVDAIAEENALDKKQTRALEQILRVYALRKSLPAETLFYTGFRPERGDCSSLQFVANWRGWIVVKKRETVGKKPHEILFFLSSVEDSIRRKIRELLPVSPPPKRRPSKSALHAALQMYREAGEGPNAKLLLRVALESFSLPMEYGVAYELIKPKARGRRAK